MARYCERCGSPARMHDRYCPKCGAALEVGYDTQGPDLDASRKNHEYENLPDPRNNSRRKKARIRNQMKKHLTLCVAFAVLAVLFFTLTMSYVIGDGFILAIVCFVVCLFEFFMFRRRQKELSPNPSDKGLSISKLAYGTIISIAIVTVLVMIVSVIIEAEATPCLIIIGVYFVVSLLINGYGRSTSCPECKKAFALVEVKRDIAGSYRSSMDVERTVRDREGHVIRRYTEAVPATQYVYDCEDKCKYCGHVVNVTRGEKVRN